MILSERIRLLVRGRYRGGVMLFALVISMLIVLLISSVISIHQYHSVSYLYCSGFLKMRANLESGVLLALNGNPSAETSTQVLDLYGNGSDTVNIRTWDYGLFSGFEVKARYKNISFRKQALTAQECGDMQLFYLPDHSRSIKMSGATELRGTVYFPASGYEAAYLSGSSLITQPFVSKPRLAKDHLPEMNPELKKRIPLIMDAGTSASDSVLAPDLFLAADSITNPFDHKTLRVEFPSSVVIRNKYISGNIVITCRNKAVIESTARISDAVVISRYVEIADKFAGSIQVFVSDTLVTGEKCDFLYPSAFVCRQQKNRNAALLFGKENKVNGCVLGLRNADNLHQAFTLQMAEAGTINGQVYFEGPASLQGSINGILCIEKTFVHTTSSVNDNYMYNLKVNTEKLPGNFCGVQLFAQPDYGQKTGKTILKWIGSSEK